MALPRTLYYGSPFPVTTLTKDWRSEAAKDGILILSSTGDIASDWVEEDWEERADESDLQISMYEIRREDLKGKLKPLSGSAVDFSLKLKKNENVPLTEIPWATLDKDEV
jgi:hypothetical protein